MNVDINKEVQRAMMSPSQDQGIVNLLASELKARDAKARQQINNLMAGQPDPNSIMAQNEREVENSVRQEIGQKMQARVMQERQAQARQRQALAGIAGQRAPNMRMADGGIVGYAPGGDVEVGSGQPIPMLMQKYGSEKVMEFLEKEKQLKDIEGNVAPERREEFEMMKANIESLFDPQMVRDIRRAQTGPDEIGMAEGGLMFDAMGFPSNSPQFLKNYVSNRRPLSSRPTMGPPDPRTKRFQEETDSLEFLRRRIGERTFLEGLRDFMGEEDLKEFLRDKEVRRKYMQDHPELLNQIKARKEATARLQEVEMAGGGIVGLQEGGMPRFPRLFDFSMFLAEKGIDSLAGLSADAVNRLTQEYQAMQAREMNRPRGDSVSESQMENLGGVLRGAGNVLTEGLASLAPEPQGRNRTELADMGGAPGAGGAPQARREPSAADLADAQAEMDILNAAQQRRNEAERAAREPQPYVLSDLAEGAGLASFFSGIPSFEEMYPPNPEDASLAYKVGSATRALGTPFKVLSGFLQPKDEGQLTFSDVGPIASEFTAGLTGAEMPTQQTDEEVAEEIIATAPETTTAASTEDADAAAMRGVPQIANPSLRRAIEGTQEEPAPTQEAVIDTASTVAQNPTPENTSRFESEIQRLMERRESPVRALSDFLTSFSQARGGSMGQNLAIATAGMRAADDALDKQIVELEKLRRADQISERDFGLKQDQLEAQKGLLEAQASYYANYREMQTEIAGLREKGDIDVANRRLYQSILDLASANLPAYRMAAMASLNSKDISSPEVVAEASRLMKEAIRTEFRDAQRYFQLSGDVNTGAANFGDQFADTMTVTP